MTTTLSRKSNGFGSGTAEIAVVIQKPYHTLIQGDDIGWEVLSEEETSVTFLYKTDNRYKGDDETIVQSLWNDLPEEITKNNSFHVEWEHSMF